jgi:hypothetical protein
VNPRSRRHSQAWRGRALFTIYRLARRGQPFTADDVRRVMKRDSPDEPATVGGVFLLAVKLGYITPTGAYVKSTRAECHGRPMRMWRIAPNHTK